MVKQRQDLYITVPSFFKCPISLDIMKSPVSLSTGVTYDRCSIQKWLDEGHNTCPATMQVLESKEIIPNYTLRRLIQAKDILQDIRNGAVDCEILNDLLKYAAESDKNRERLVKAGAVSILAQILSSRGKSGEICAKMMEIRSLAVKIFLLIPHNERTVRILASPETLSAFAEIFVEGTSEAKIEAAKLLESLLTDGDVKGQIASHDGLLMSLLRISEADAKVMEAVLRCLHGLCTPKRNRLNFVRLGAVGHMTKLLRGADGKIAEQILGLLEFMSGSAEGRTSICDQPLCLQTIVQKMLKISVAATEHCVITLWSVCCLSADRRARNAVMQSGGLTKLLLLMQSDCSPAVRQMAGDLLKIFREKSKEVCRNYSYDSKMTHITPF
ncbi:hypothetical protein SUGI_1199490 [Cryptomeria japonica]|nr:hypothetical protein SUGI_1199490 [Cryptomeria japonica]